MKTTNRTLSVLATSIVFIACFAIAGTASAAPITPGTVIGVDFGEVAPANFFNPAAVPNAANGSIAAGSVIDTSNVVVDGVGFSWAGGDFNNDDPLVSARQPVVFDNTNTTDWLGANSGTMTLTFTGLADAATYELLIGARFGNTVPDTTWTADGQSDTTVSTADATAWLTFSGLKTDGFGNLVITSAGAVTNISAVSALTLTVETPIPEPSTAILACLGLVGLTLRRRRHNR